MFRLNRRKKRIIKKYIANAMLGLLDIIYIIAGCFCLAFLFTLAFLVLTNL